MPHQEHQLTLQISTLILQIQAEDSEAINQLLRLLEPLIRQRIRHQSITATDSDDLLQDISLKICKSIIRYNVSSTIPFDHFLNRLIKTTKYDYFRKQSRLNKQIEYLIEAAKCQHQFCTAKDGMDQKLIVAEEIESMNFYCKNLSKLELEVVQYILDEYSPKETANAMGVNEKTVYNALHRCKIKLRKAFQCEKCNV